MQTDYERLGPNTWFQVSEGNFSSKQLPQTEGVAEHVGLHRVASALGEHLGRHPTQVLLTHTETRGCAQTHTSESLLPQRDSSIFL